MVIPSSPSGRARGGWSVLGVPSEVVHFRTSFFVPEVMPEGYENVLKPFSSHPCKWEWVQVENKAHLGSSCGELLRVFFSHVEGDAEGGKKAQKCPSFSCAHTPRSIAGPVTAPEHSSNPGGFTFSLHFLQGKKKNKGKKESIRACCNASKMNFLYV